MNLPNRLREHPEGKARQSHCRDIPRLLIQSRIRGSLAAPTASAITYIAPSAANSQNSGITW